MSEDHTLKQSDPRARRPDGTYDIFAIDQFSALVENFGAPSNPEMPDAATIARYDGRLPDDLLAFWSRHGWGSWAQGKYWLCDPAFVQPVLDVVFASDREFDPAKMTAYAYNAFGQLDIWLGDGASMRLDLPRAYVSTQQRAFIQMFDRWNTDHAAIAGTIGSNIANRELLPDAKRRDLFPQALAAHGELARGEIYGFFPALELGGPRKVANIQRTPLVAHLAFLNAVQPPMLHTYALPAAGAGGFGTVTPVRRIGQS